MWVKFERTDTEEFHDSDCMPEGYTVELNYEGVAQVRQEVGEALIEKYDTITERD